MEDLAFESLTRLVNDMTSDNIAEEAFLLGTTNNAAIHKWKAGFAYSWKALKERYKSATNPDDQMKLLFDQKKLLMQARDQVAVIPESAAMNNSVFFSLVAGTLAATVGVASGALFIPGVGAGMMAGVTSGLGMLYTFVKGKGVAMGNAEFHGSKNIPNQAGMGVMGKQMTINKINGYIAETDEKIQYVLAGKVLSINNAVAKAVDKYSDAMVDKVSSATDRLSNNLSNVAPDIDKVLNMGGAKPKDNKPDDKPKDSGHGHGNPPPKPANH